MADVADVDIDVWGWVQDVRRLLVPIEHGKGTSDEKLVRDLTEQASVLGNPFWYEIAQNCNWRAVELEDRVFSRRLVGCVMCQNTCEEMFAGHVRVIV